MGRLSEPTAVISLTISEVHNFGEQLVNCLATGQREPFRCRTQTAIAKQQTECD